MSEKMRTFWVRTASATVYAALFLGAIFSGQLLGNRTAGIYILTAFALFVTLGCTFEYFRISKKLGHHPNQAIGYLCAGFLAMGVGLAELDTPINLLAILIVFLAFPTTLMIELWRHSDQPFSDVADTFIPTIYCALPLGLMPLLNGKMVLAMCVILVWVNDSFAYMGGSLVGRHKMWPRHSPGKTWEGTAIGVAACIATALLVGPLFNDRPSWVFWLATGLICSVIGTLGDLVESMLKRSAGLKDSGNIMPGHGGFLDRFDSLLMILPFVYFATLI